MIDPNDREDDVILYLWGGLFCLVVAAWGFSLMYGTNP